MSLTDQKIPSIPSTKYAECTASMSLIANRLVESLVPRRGSGLGNIGIRVKANGNPLALWDPSSGDIQISERFVQGQDPRVIWTPEWVVLSPTNLQSWCLALHEIGHRIFSRHLNLKQILELDGQRIFETTKNLEEGRMESMLAATIQTVLPKDVAKIDIYAIQQGVKDLLILDTTDSKRTTPDIPPGIQAVQLIALTAARTEAGIIQPDEDEAMKEVFRRLKVALGDFYDGFYNLGAQTRALDISYSTGMKEFERIVREWILLEDEYLKDSEEGTKCPPVRRTKKKEGGDEEDEEEKPVPTKGKSKEGEEPEEPEDKGGGKGKSEETDESEEEPKDPGEGGDEGGEPGDEPGDEDDEPGDDGSSKGRPGIVKPAMGEYNSGDFDGKELSDLVKEMLETIGDGAEVDIADSRKELKELEAELLESYAEDERIRRDRKVDARRGWHTPSRSFKSGESDY